MATAETLSQPSFAGRITASFDSTDACGGEGTPPEALVLGLAAAAHLSADARIGGATANLIKAEKSLRVEPDSPGFLTHFESSLFTLTLPVAMGGVKTRAGGTMIIVVTSAGHPYTHTRLDAVRDQVNVGLTRYHALIQEGSRDDAVYIFADLDRFSHERLKRICELYQELRQKGRVVLNDPTRFLTRYGLLRRLKQIGINDFDAYRVEEGARPRRWPVFIRIEGSHDAPLTGLISSPDQLDRAIEDCIRAGYAVSSLLIVEYNGQPAAPGLFRRLSVFRVGDRLFGALAAHDDNWLVKYGRTGAATPELYEDEHRQLRDNVWGEFMRPIFDLAGIQYGRLDFGMVDGRPQIYEINPNPFINLYLDPHPYPKRDETVAIFRQNYLAAMRAIDPQPSPALSLASA